MIALNIEKVEYNYEDADMQELVEDAMESIETEYDGSSTNFHDLVHEVADAHTPIHYKDIWENAEKVSEFADDAIGEMGYNGESVQQLIQQGYYFMIRSAIHENEEAIKWNYMITYINDRLSEEDESVIESIKSYLASEDTDINIHFEDFIEDNSLMDYDTFDKLDDLAKEYIEQLTDGASENE